jgi:Ca2+-binding EF-hand superfamily protein
MSTATARSRLAGLLIACLACTALAQGGPGRQRVFSVHDMDGDGYLDETEYQVLAARLRQRHAAAGMTAEQFPPVLGFAELDRDGDGRVSEQELTRVLAKRLRLRAHRAEHGE